MNPFKNDLFESGSHQVLGKAKNNQRGEMIKLSPSSLNILLECPRCFWLYINKGIKRPSIPVATITTGLDKVIKEYFNLFRAKDALPSILEGKVPGKLIRNLPHKGWLEFMDNEIGARLGGYLDECLDLGDNFYAALDHKTRGSRPADTHRAHQFQMDVYTFLLGKNGLPTKDLAYLIYYIPKVFATAKTIEFDVFPVEVKTDPLRAKKVFYEAVEMLKESIPSAAKECEFCKWTSTADIR